MQLPADFNKMAPCLISAPAPLQKGETRCLRRTHVELITHVTHLSFLRKQESTFFADSCFRRNDSGA